MTDDEVQRQLNAFDEFYAEDEPEPPDPRMRVVLCVLSSAVSLSVLYWVWRMAHG